MKNNQNSFGENNTNIHDSMENAKHVFLKSWIGDQIFFSNFIDGRRVNKSFGELIYNVHSQKC